MRRRPRVACPALAAMALLVLSACGSAVTVSSSVGPACATPGPELRPDSFAISATYTTTPLGLRYADLAIGCGALAREGSQVSVNYTGWLSNGKEFDTSRAAGRGPYPFTIGSGQVIQGFDDGVLGMRVGGRRRLVLPPALAYGSQGNPPVIPANATIIFTVELMSVH